ncbi:hypothetical protein BC567DRAFT_294672 [Phyllosticta citribraziliensis]
MASPDDRGPKPPDEKTATSNTEGVTTDNTVPEPSPIKSIGPTWNLRFEKTTLQVSHGQDLTVILVGSNFQFTIRHDNLGKPLIFGTGSSQLKPTTFEREGGFDLTLSTRRFHTKFDFFGLPIEIREMIYGFVYHASPGPPYWPLDALQNPNLHEKEFHYKRPFTPLRFLRFLAELNKSAAPRYGIAFVNKRVLSETTPFILGSRNFHLNNSGAASSLLESIGYERRKKWYGRLTLKVDTRWTSSWSDKLYSSGLTNEISMIKSITIVIGKNGWNLDGKYLSVNDAPLGHLAHRIGGCSGKWPHLKMYFIPPLENNTRSGFIHSQFESAFRGEVWKGGFLQQGGITLLLQKVYLAMEKAAKGRRF